MEVTVVVATFGDVSWRELGTRRAIPSVPASIPVVPVHAGTLHEARNEGLAKVDTEWVCWLDADDELEDGYFDHMAGASADLRAPAVRYMRAHYAQWPIMPRVAGHNHDCTAECLAFGNWLVIGTLVRTEMARAVGGFRDFAWSEDFDFWVRCWQAGATIEAVPGAIYRAHVRPDSRNRGQTRAQKLAAHQAIARANGLPVPG